MSPSIPNAFPPADDSTALSADAAADAAGRAYVQRLQPSLRQWLLMYSLRQRGLLAFFLGNCPRGGVIVVARHPDELVDRINALELDTWQLPAAAASPLPSQPAPGFGGLL